MSENNPIAVDGILFGDLVTALKKKLNDDATDGAECINKICGEICQQAIEIMDSLEAVVYTCDRAANPHDQYTEKDRDFYVKIKRDHVARKTARLKDDLDQAAGAFLGFQSLHHDEIKKIEEYHRGLSNAYIRVNTELEQAKKQLCRQKTHDPLDPEVRKAVHATTDGLCFYCDRPIALNAFEVDHIVPKASGGPDHMSNFAPSCKGCNASKNSHNVVEFMKRLKAKKAALVPVALVAGTDVEPKEGAA